MNEHIEKILAFFRMLYVGTEMMGHGMGMDHPGDKLCTDSWSFFGEKAGK
jgi:hypothetical protein